jgi:hypothetical protein
MISETEKWLAYRPMRARRLVRLTRVEGDDAGGAAESEDDTSLYLISN